MVRYCSVYGCHENTKANRNRRFFCFPSDERRCKYWLKAVGRMDLENKSINILNRSYFVCELHFAGSDRLKKYLRRDAVPTLLLPQPDDTCGTSKYTQTDDIMHCSARESQLSAVIPTFHGMQNNYGKIVDQNIRQENGNSGALKKFMFADQLQLLTILPLQHSKNDGLSTSLDNDNSEHVESDYEEDRKPNVEELNSRLRREMDDTPPHIEDIFDAASMSVQQPEDRHVSFFKGIIPSLYTFTDDESIQFQMGVLQLITDIKQNRSHILADA